MATFNKNFRLLRSLTNMSIAKFAKDLEALDIPSSSIASYEDLERNITPSTDRIQAFKNFFNSKYEANLTWDMLMEDDLEELGYSFNENIRKKIDNEITDNIDEIILSKAVYQELLNTINNQAQAIKDQSSTINKLVKTI